MAQKLVPLFTDAVQLIGAKDTMNIGKSLRSQRKADAVLFAVDGVFFTIPVSYTHLTLPTT